MSDVAPSPGVMAVGLATRPQRLNLTERNFVKALVYCGLCVLVFWCGYYFERTILNRHPADIRFIREASEAAMRYITIPHIIIGFLFLVTSPKNRTREKRLWVAALLVAGVGLCALFHLGGGKASAVCYLGVYLYFLVHELRDEAMFYTILGDARPIPDRAVFDRMVRVLIALIVLTVGAMVWSLVPWGTYREKYPGGGPLVDGALPLAAKLLFGTGPLVLLFFAFRGVLSHYAARLGYPNTAALLSAHATLFRVVAGVPGVLGLALLITQRPYSLILFHVVAWYIFALHQLRRHPPKSPPRGWWTWMRTTPTGFRTLHIGMVLVLMAIGLVWTLALGQTIYLHWLLAPESFLYWTIMHITVSFVPR